MGVPEGKQAHRQQSPQGSAPRRRARRQTTLLSNSLPVERAKGRARRQTVPFSNNLHMCCVRACQQLNKTRGPDTPHRRNPTDTPTDTPAGGQGRSGGRPGGGQRPLDGGQGKVRPRPGAMPPSTRTRHMRPPQPSAESRARSSRDQGQSPQHTDKTHAPAATATPHTPTRVFWVCQPPALVRGAQSLRDRKRVKKASNPHFFSRAFGPSGE